MKKIILASASPRRIEMMKNNGYDPVVVPADINETLPIHMPPETAVMYLALKKALMVDAFMKREQERIVIAADTIVLYKNNIIGKPKNRTEAFEILSQLRGKSHHVITGVCIIDAAENIKTCFYEDTAVFFKHYSNKELNAYVDTDEPYDKAGGYAIQGTFEKYIDHIEGDYDNVVGFPWKRIRPYLSPFRISLE